jgi:hypothetical protein
MDFQLNRKILPPPKNIKISHPKGPGQLLVVWDQVKNPESKVQSGIRIRHVKYNIYRSTSLGGIFYKINNI